MMHVVSNMCSPKEVFSASTGFRDRDLARGQMSDEVDFGVGMSCSSRPLLVQLCCNNNTTEQERLVCELFSCLI